MGLPGVLPFGDYLGFWGLQGRNLTVLLILSPRLRKVDTSRIPVFRREATVDIGWDFLIRLT